MRSTAFTWMFECGLSAYRDLGLNCLRWFDNYGIDHANKVNQTPGSYFNFATSADRSPPFNETIKEIDEHGRVLTCFQIHHRDQATLINLPGSQSSVAILMHVLVPRVIDNEFVDTPGPHWEIGELARDVECDRTTNLMQGAQIVWGVRGEHRAKPEPIEIISDTLHSTEPESMQSHMTVAESWSRLDAWLQAMPNAVPEGFKDPACDDEIQILEGALGVKLPDDFIASLKIHNGQAGRCTGCFDGDYLLSVRGILKEWTSWRDLVVEGSFEGITSDPDGGVKDDWFNLRWIPFAANGMGDCLCLDFDPAPGGTVGQVVRVLHDDERRECLAASFEQWLDGMAKDLTGLAHQDK